MEPAPAVPGRPKKGSKPPASQESKSPRYAPGLTHQDMPDLHIPRAAEDR